METLKIQILHEHSHDLVPHGCSYIRLLIPLAHPKNEGQFEITYGVDFDEGVSDIYIVERLWKPDITLQIAENLVQKIRRSNKLLIYSIDDNLLDLNHLNDNSLSPSVEQKNIVRFFAREADGLLVSTDELKSRLVHLNDKIAVVGNAIDERLFRKQDIRIPEKESNIKVIGYMGTHSHDADLMMILQALRGILKKYRNSVKLELIGVLANASILKLFNGLPVEILDVNGNHEYTSFIQWMRENVHWDLAIAPLENNSFTRCKSDLKFLDYSALGIPGIYSKTLPYEGSIQHLTNGYMTSNNTDEWYTSLETMLNNDELRRGIADKAYEYVYSKRTLEHRADEWFKAITSIVSN